MKLFVFFLSFFLISCDSVKTKEKANLQFQGFNLNFQEKIFHKEYKVFFLSDVDLFSVPARGKNTSMTLECALDTDVMKFNDVNKFEAEGVFISDEDLSVVFSKEEVKRIWGDSPPKQGEYFSDKKKYQYNVDLKFRPKDSSGGHDSLRRDDLVKILGKKKAIQCMVIKLYYNIIPFSDNHYESHIMEIPTSDILKVYN